MSAESVVLVVAWAFEIPAITIGADTVEVDAVEDGGEAEAEAEGQIETGELDTGPRIVVADAAVVQERLAP